MFKKCLKYDLKAFAKIWLIAAAVVLVVSVLCSLGMSGFVDAAVSMEEFEDQQDAPFGPMVLLITKFIIGMISYIVILYVPIIFMAGTSIMLYVRYYTKFFTDQGYLTFTLPVSRSTQFWSKAVAGLIYSAASGLVSAVSFIMFFATVMVSVLLNPAISEDMFGENLTAFLQSANMIYSIIAILLGVLLISAFSFASLMMQYLIITLAATLFRKLKVLSVIVAYYVINNIIALPVMYLGVYYFIFAIMFAAMGLIPVFTALPILGWLGIYALLILGTVAAVTIGLIFANFTVQRLERKLNLA